MKKINSVCGEISTDDLGFTLMHEHVMVIDSFMRYSFPDWFARDGFIRKVVNELSEARQKGVRTIVDATPINLGRDISVIKEASEKSGVQIIASTGFYWYDEPWMDGWGIEALMEKLLREINHGIQGTDIKPGVIKAATDFPGMTPVNFKLLKTSARLARATDLPLITHSCPSRMTGLMQQDVFLAEKVDPARVVIGHSGDTDDIEYLEAILKRGSYVGLDRFGLDMVLPVEKRIATVIELVKRGHTDKILLSHDYCCYIDWTPEFCFKEGAEHWSYTYLPAQIIPEMKKRGISDEAIRIMTVENPKRIFTE
ncbi:MAG: phosphotriesterase [Candidatus Eremiobacteraeota bacterium]|nr:phosphotriesterase [Candidatus Eremiobacteraeota bacterium]